MRNTRPNTHIFTRLLLAAAWALLLALPSTGTAQQGFEDRLSFEEIKKLLAEASTPTGHDLRQQGLGWYKWAIYRENETGNRDSAFQYLVRSADLFAQAKDTLAYHRVRYELAIRMAERGLVADALQIQREALDYFRATGNRRLEILVMAQMGHLSQTMGDTAQASQLTRASREKAQLLNDTLLLITVSMNEAMAFQSQGDFKNALPMAFRALELSDEIGRSDLVTKAAFSIGTLSEKTHDYLMALRAYNRAENSNAISDVEMRQKIYQRKTATYVALDSLQQAVGYALRSMKLSDTLLNSSRIETANRLAVLYGTKDKDQKILDMRVQQNAMELSKQRQRDFFYVLLLFFGAIILALIFMVRDYRHRLYTNRVISQQIEQINQQTIRQLEDNLKIESMQSMLEGQESERRRVAHDLHDSLGGLLAATKMRLDNLSGKLPASTNDELAKIKGLLDDTITETRQIARNLQPGSLHQFGLMKAVQDLTGRVQGDGVPVIDYQHFGDFTQLDHTIALNCYRIVQELLQNSLKHAKATEILVQLTRTDGELALLVEDNGIGYQPEVTPKGMGTDNVAQRVQFLKGEISIQSAEGQGTSTLVTVPC